MIRTLATAVILMLGLAAGSGCMDRTPTASAAPPEGPSGRLVLTGSSTLGPLASEIARRFEHRNPGVRIDIQTGGSSRGIADVQRGTADIGMSSRPLTNEESVGLRSRAIAQDGVCFLVNVANPVTELTSDQLRDVYLGRIRNWSELGGANARITVIDRAAGRSELDLVTRHLSIDRAEIVADVIAGENQQGIKLVAGDPNAIIYMSVGTSEYEAAHGAPIRLLPLDGVPATTEAVASGRYSLGRPLLFVAPTEPDPLTRAFLEFATSDEVHDLVREQSFAPVR